MRKTQMLSYSEGKKLLKYITSNATRYKLDLVLANGIPNRLQFVIPPDCMLDNTTKIAADSGVMYGHLWYNVSIANKTDKKIFNFVWCPLKFLADVEQKILILRLKEIAKSMEKCPVIITDTTKSHFLVGEFDLEVFKLYSDGMFGLTNKPITDTMIQEYFSESCEDCHNYANKIKYVKSKDFLKKASNSMLTQVEIENDNNKRTADNYMKRFK